MAAGADVEDIHALSAVQQGMLVHSAAARGQDPYVVQMTCRLDGPFQPALFGAAWQVAAARHPVLRSTVHWRGLRTPIQVVHRTVDVPLRVIEDDAGTADWADICAADRAEGFNLASAPLMRVTVLACGRQTHRLLWTHHHLILDGWSIAVLLGEVLQSYERLVAGAEPMTGRAPAYADHCRTAAVPDPATMVYWRTLLAGHRGPTALPIALPAPTALPTGTETGRPSAGTVGDTTVGGDAARSRDVAAVTDRVRDWARRWRTTVGAVHHLAWTLTLSAHTHASDLVVGSTVSLRPARSTDEDTALGPMINTVPVRLDLGRGRTVRSILDDVVEQLVVQAGTHHAALAAIKAVSDVPSEQPLFTASIAIENYPADRDVDRLLDGVRVTDVRWRNSLNAALSLVVVPAEGLVSLSFDPTRFDDWTVERMLDLHVAILGRLVDADPEDTVGELLRRAVDGTSGETTDQPAALVPLPVSFAEHVARAPEAPAVRDGDVVLTYGELGERVARVSDALHMRGIGPGDRVSLVVEPSADLLIGMLAVLDVGAAYVPVNPADPQARQQEVHRLAGSALTVLAEPGVSPVGAEGPTLLLGTVESVPGHAVGRGARIGDLDPAYVMFTSGSTGRPKGVVIPHLALANYLHWAARTYDLGPGTVTPAHSSPTFDLSVTALLGPLSAGGQVTIAGRGGGEGLLAHLGSSAGTGTVKLTPAHLAAYRTRRPTGRRDTVVVGGEELRGPLVGEWLADNPQARFYNEYGPTEATVGCVVHRVVAGDVGESAGPVPIGHAIPGSGFRILDDQLDDCAVGAVGELFLTGDCLAIGYLAAPRLTAESFLPLPGPGGGGRRMYRTGDLVRQGPQGLVYLGRKDDQVKVRGFRVELGEIDAKLISLPQVEAAAVVLDADDGLKAFVVPADGHRIDAAELATALEELVPTHMVPARYATLDRLPLSASGKVDRQRLHGQRAELAVDTAVRAEPTTPTEQALVDAWRQVLGQKVVGVDDDFFRLGGDSLAAMTVLAQVSASLQDRFSAAEVLACRTPRALARRIDAQQTSPRDAGGGDPVRRQGLLSPAQIRFFVLHNLDPAAYNCSSAVLVRGELDRASLQGAVDLAIARHAVLRTSFAPADGQPVATVRPHGTVPVEYVDLRGSDDLRRPDEARSVVAGLVGRPFDLAEPPLARVAVIALSDDVHVLALVLHHIVSDGRSQAVLVRELFEDYATIRDGGSRVRADTAQYADVVTWPTESAQQQGVEFWRSRLGTPLPELLVTDVARPPLGTPAPAGQIRLPLDGAVWSALDALGRDLGVSVFSTLSATLRVLLTRFTGASGDVAIGTPVSLRDTAVLADVVGPLINTVVLRATVDLARPAVEVLVAEQDTVATALSHKDVPFERLARDLASSDGNLRNPLFDVLLDFQRIGSTLPAQAGLTLEGFDHGPPPARFDLQVDVWEALGEVTVGFTYRADLFDEQSVRSLADGYVSLLAGLVADPWAPVAQLPLGSGPGSRTAVSAGPVRDRGAFEPLDDSVRRHAADRPDAVAVRAGDDELTYRDLNCAVDALAARLQERGVGPEVLVGVAVDRSVAQLVAVLGVLRAGGVYFPLDPQLPDDRLAWMVADAGPVLVLADAGNRPRAEGLGVPVVPVGSVVPCGTSDRPRRPDLVPTNAAYVIYTSGSTGRPKGVVVSHEALVNRIRWAQDTFVLDGDDRVLHKTPVGFDVSVWELLWPQTAGATTIMTDPGAHGDIDRLARVLHRERVTVVHFVPSLLRVAVDHGVLAASTSLRFVICSGEVLPASLHADAQASTAARVWNLYGPTEAAIDVTAWAGVGDRARPRVPLGAPVDNTSIVIMDDRARVQPANAVGELCIAGVQLARSYVGRPGLTADMFRPDPTGTNPGGRLYRTGDLGRVRVDGTVEYLGRRDDQVKVRGYRVELGEIESVLSGHPAVTHCAVRVVDGPGGTALQAAYVAPGPVDEDELAQFCAGLLPSAMVPTFWSEVDAIPRGASGKVDRSALPEPRPARPRSSEPPAPGAETGLAAVWRDILPGELDIGRADSFFSLGGDSILALRLIARARENGLRLTLPDVFDAPTLAGMAARAVGPSAGPAAHGYEPFALLSAEQRARLPVSAVDGYPLTALQSGMVFHALYEPDTYLYKNFDSVRIRDGFVRTAFVTAVGSLIARHAVLRTGFDLSPQVGLFQVVHDTVPADVQVTDLRRLNAAAADQAFAAWRDTQLRVVWDFSTAPLIGFHVHLFGDGTFRVSLPHHHAILDGWSLSLLAAELVTTYRRVVDGGAPPQVDPATRDGFARYVADELRAVRDDAARAFWDHTLAVTGPGALLVSGSGGTGPAAVRIAFTDQETDDVRAWGVDRGLPLKSVLFAVHCAVLAAASGQGRFVTGMIVNGRAEDAGGLGALGLFLNSTPVPVDLAGQTWESLAFEAFKSERAALPYRNVPMELLRRRCGRTPLFDTLFNFTHFRVLDAAAPMAPDAVTAADPVGHDVVDQESHTNASIPLVANFDLSANGRLLSVELAGGGVDLGGHDLDGLARLYRDGVRRLLAGPHDPAVPGLPGVDGTPRA